MISIVFEWNWPGISKGTLFGKHDKYPLTSIRAGVAIITYLPSSTSGLFRKALEGLAKDEKWLVKNSAEVEKYKK